jgi:hypothetical protein
VTALAKVRLVIGAVLVALPALAGSLLLTDVLQVEGGHGLGTWFAAGICAVLVLLGTILCAVSAWRSVEGRRFAIAMVWLGTGALFLFVALFGLPFGR